ncbi:MAG: bifunctional oligoribonuclease/PAP phosphatase NrnA, partial [Treponema sp.]|nr:bifunctional oligoribonuclease/PAP phosphatase NrnA [Treponema sp.]
MNCETENLILNDLVQFIKTASKFLIAGHKEPDGDCVGCQLALRSILLRLGKEAQVCSAGPFKRTELRNYYSQFLSVQQMLDFCKPET